MATSTELTESVGRILIQEAVAGFDGIDEAISSNTKPTETLTVSSEPYPNIDPDTEKIEELFLQRIQNGA